MKRSQWKLALNRHATYGNWRRSPLNDALNDALNEC